MTCRWLALLTILVAGLCHAQADAPCQPGMDAAQRITLCGFDRPEDVEFVRDRALVVVSEQGWQAPQAGGSISAIVLDGIPDKRRLWPTTASVTSSTPGVGDPTCTTPPADGRFSPHGLGVRRIGSTVRVAVVGHGAREAIELFDLLGSGSTARLEWRGCVPLPPETAGNDVAIHPDGRLFVTNYCPSVQDLRAYTSLLRAMRGEPTGDVIVWSAARGWRHLIGTDAALPNGILFNPSDAGLYVAESAKQRVTRFTLDGEEHIARREDVQLSGTPDNMNLTAAGKILVAVLRAGNTNIRAPQEWWLEELDPATLARRVLIKDQIALLHSVTAATDVGPAIVLGSMTDNRVAIVPWAATER